MQIALLIDADNVAAKHMPAVFGYLGSIGNIKMAKAFGRASTLHSKKWVEVIQTYAINIKEHQHEGNNSADFSLSIHGTELLIKYPHIGCFCIASSDADFIHLVLHLQGHGKQVIGIGNETAASKLRQACNQYLVLDDLSTSIPSEKVVIVDDRKQQLNSNPKLIDSIKTVLAIKSKDNQYVKLSAVAGILGNEPRCLKAKNYGYKSWKDLFFDLDCVDTTIDGVNQVLVRMRHSKSELPEAKANKAAISSELTGIKTAKKLGKGKILTDVKYAFYKTRVGDIDGWASFADMLAFLQIEPNSEVADAYLSMARAFFEEQTIDGLTQFRFKNPNRGKYRHSKAADNFRVNPNAYQESFHYRPTQRQPMTDWECCMADMGIPSDAWDWYDDD